MACDPSTLALNAKLTEKLPGFEEPVITYLLCQWAAAAVLAAGGIQGEGGGGLGGEGGGIIIGE